MKLQVGQRWLCKNPQCLVEILKIKAVDGATVQILQSNDYMYSVGDKNDFYYFPFQNNLDSNSFWQYLHGQDKPV
jgi:hypothetical protein